MKSVLGRHRSQAVPGRRCTAHSLSACGYCSVAMHNTQQILAPQRRLDPAEFNPRRQRIELFRIRASACGGVVSYSSTSTETGETRSCLPSRVIIIIIIINVLIKVTLNERRCRGTLQSQWSTLTDSTSLKAEESVNVTDESRSSWYGSWNRTGGSSDDGGRWRQTRRSGMQY